MATRRERRRRRNQGGGMSNESAIFDPKTGESYSGGPNTPDAKAQRLRIAEALRILDEGGPEEVASKLLRGEDVDPETH